MVTVVVCALGFCVVVQGGVTGGGGLLEGTMGPGGLVVPVIGCAVVVD